MIVVAGQALIDLIVGLDGGITAAPGGGPCNTARTIARLGQPVTFLGRISTDRFGRELRANLRRDGVAEDGVIATDDPTTLAVAELDDHGVADYRFYVEGTSDRRPDRHRRAHGDRRGAQGPPCRGARAGPRAHRHDVERLVEESGHERLVMLDPNCRPSATPDPASFRARIGRIGRRADVVKVSADELRFLAPDDAPTR